MFTKSAPFYDAIHGPRHDYPNEARWLRDLVRQRQSTTSLTLLDVACGTGALLSQLQQHFTVEGLDLNEAMLEVARARNPAVPFHHADLADFDLGRQFDVVLCLGSSIGYVRTTPRLRRALQTLSRHLARDGVLVVEPWFSPTDWEAGRTTMDVTETSTLKVARLMVSGKEGTLSTSTIHHLVGSPAGVDYFVERHEMGLFSQDDYLAAFRAVGLDVQYDLKGFLGRGLYLGVKTSEPPSVSSSRAMGRGR